MHEVSNDNEILISSSPTENIDAFLVQPAGIVMDLHVCMYICVCLYMCESVRERERERERGIIKI